MLNDGKPIFYWDACIPLSYINGYADRLPDIEGLMQKSGKDFHIISSIFSITEVAFAQVEQGQKQLDPAQEEKINKLWRKGSPIQLVELFQTIAEDARALMRTALTKGWSLKPSDAIHLATADHFKVTTFHTYDTSLKKYEEITKTHFPIEVPLAPQPVLLLPLTPPEESQSIIPAPKGLTDAASEQRQPAAPADSRDAGGSTEENNKLQADPAHSTAVQGSDGGRAQGEATTENPKKS
jgi:predicted nucleic acid-binding protein